MYVSNKNNANTVCFKTLGFGVIYEEIYISLISHVIFSLASTICGGWYLYEFMHHTLAFICKILL